jgi:branched-chain amino acid transport system substrate-binding protein
MPSARSLLVLTSILMAVGCARKEPEPVYVGHLVPFGTPDRRGEHAKQGVALAVEDALANGKLVAGRKVAVLHVESGGEPEHVRFETVRLITVNKVAALLAGPDSASALRVIQTAEPYEVPVIVPCELPDGAVGKSVVSLSPPPESRGQVLARFANRNLKARRAALLTAAGQPIASAVTKGFRKEWLRDEKAVLDEWTYQKDTDTAELVARVAKAQPNVVLLGVDGDEGLKLFGQLRKDGYSGPILHGGADGSSAALLKEVSAEADVYLATVFVVQALADKDDFAKRYVERFHEPPDLFAAQAYDAARLLFETMEKTGSFQYDRLSDAFAGLESYTTRTGPLTWKEHKARRRVFVVHLKEGKAEVTQTVEPGE